MVKKLLIIEDDREINSLLHTHFEQNSYRAESAYTGTDGMRLLKAETYDLVVLDIMLPFKSGDAVLEELRTFSDVPVLVLSAKDMTRTKVDMLHLGADDYLTKPFDLDEILARAEAICRRSYRREQTEGHERECLRYEDYVNDDNTLNVHMSNLRNKLRAAGGGTKYIETVWGMGYRLYKED